MAEKEPVESDKEKKEPKSVIETKPTTVEKEEKPEVETPRVGGELLSVLEDFGRIDKSSALRELNISSETFDNWVSELEKDDWIKVSDRELEDYYVELTKKFSERIEQLKELKKQEESFPEDKQLKKIRFKDLLAPSRNAVLSLVSRFRSSIIDIIIVSALLLTIYLVITFIENPDDRVLNFLAAVVLFSELLLSYRSSREKLKTKTLLEKTLEFSTIMLKEWRVLLFSLFIVVLIYFVGWMVLYPEHRVLSILLCTIVLSSVIQLYYPMGTLSQLPKFYFGMALIVYSMLLIADVAKVSPIMFETENRLVDFSSGIALMAVVYINRVFLGVRVTYFRKMLFQEEEK